MIDMSTLWPILLEWLTRVPETIRTLDPVILALLAAPFFLALFTLNGAALLLTFLLAATALLVFGFVSDGPARWAVAALACAAGLLAFFLALRLRVRERQLRHMEFALGEVRSELAEIRKKYEGEVYWRQAAERISSQERR
jgi:membrane protein implicated in regulation of membrane protease activity